MFSLAVSVPLWALVLMTVSTIYNLWQSFKFNRSQKTVKPAVLTLRSDDYSNFEPGMMVNVSSYSGGPTHSQDQTN